MDNDAKQQIRDWLAGKELESYEAEEALADLAEHADRQGVEHE